MQQNVTEIHNNHM